MYLVLKLFHIAAVVLFLGNTSTGLFWHANAARTRDPRLLAHVMEGIIRSDRWFTLPSAAIITLTGILSAIHSHLPLLHTPWILGSIVLLSLSGVLFAARVAPLSKQLYELASAGSRSGDFDYAAYHRMARSWHFWGAASTLLPVGAMVLMVLKPGS